MHYYHLHGLFFASDIALPMLSIDQPGHIDVHIKRTPGLPAQQLEHVGVGCQWQPDLFVWYLPSVGRITVEGGHTLYINQATSASDDDMVALLLGPALAALLIQRDRIPFYGNVIAYDDQQAFAVINNGPASKSTFSWHCAQAGCEVIADGLFDIQATAQGIVTTPSVPMLRLWHDACKKLSINIDALKPVRPQLKQYYYPIAACKNERYQLTHVFVLQSTRVNPAEIKIAEGLEAFRLLQNHLYGNTWIKGMGKLGVQFRQLTQMAQQVKCQRLIHESGQYPDQQTLQEIWNVIDAGSRIGLRDDVGCHSGDDPGYKSNHKEAELVG